MIEALITDFDGTLADTFEANLRAYREALAEVGVDLTEQEYRRCFGYRFDRLMEALGVTDAAARRHVRERKRECYPQHFGSLRLNRPLASLIVAMHRAGVPTAIASTARRENLMAALRHLGMERWFTLIYAADDVREGKPSPEIYLNAMARLGVVGERTLIFEDSPVGLAAAAAAGAQVIPVTAEWFETTL